MGTSGYQEYQEDQDQISGATYISEFVFLFLGVKFDRVNITTNMTSGIVEALHTLTFAHIPGMLMN